MCKENKWAISGLQFLFNRFSRMSAFAGKQTFRKRMLIPGYTPTHDQKDNGGCLCVDAKMDLSLMFFSLGLTNFFYKFFLYIFTKGGI